MKYDCEMVRDLLPGYIEKILSNTSNKIVKEHLTDCIKCKQIFNSMNEEFQQNIKEEELSDKIEYDYLKKYKRRMSLLKRFIILMIIIFIVSSMMLLIRYCYNNYVIENAYEEYKELPNLSNYTIIREYKYIDYKNMQNNINDITSIFFKDGKYKLENKNYEYYGEIDTNKQVQVDYIGKTIKNVTSNYTIVDKNYFFKTFSEINLYGSQTGISRLFIINAINVRTDSYNGRKCYVVRFQGNKTGYRDIWIDKDSMLTIRTIEEEYNIYCRENLYTLDVGNVSDEDIAFNKEKLDFNVENITSDDFYYSVVNSND